MNDVGRVHGFHPNVRKTTVHLNLLEGVGVVCDARRSTNFNHIGAKIGTHEEEVAMIALDGAPFKITVTDYAISAKELKALAGE